MALELIKSLFKSSEPTVSVKIGSGWPVKVPESFFYWYPSFRYPADNIAEAQKEGIRPVNFHQLKEQFSEDQLLSSVLFDSSPSSIFPGNHWRLLGFDDDCSSLTIQLCGSFGNFDYSFPPLTVSQYDILFTGLSTHRYEHKGNPISLFEINEKTREVGQYDENIKRKGGTTYWADSTGKLISSAEIDASV